MKEDSFKDFVLDQLTDLDNVECRAMFGGFGLYKDGIFFGIVYKGKFYLKTSEETRKKFEEKGMKPFRPNKKQTLKSYYEVPVEILESNRELIRWASQSAVILSKHA